MRQVSLHDIAGRDVIMLASSNDTLLDYVKRTITLNIFVFKNLLKVFCSFCYDDLITLYVIQDVN